MLLYPEGMVKLNGSAGAILTRCDGVRTVADIVADLERTFDATGLAADVLRVRRRSRWRSAGWSCARERRPHRGATPAARRRRPAAVAAARAHLPLPAALRVLLQPDRLRQHRRGAGAPRTGCACCARRARWARCSSGCRAASRWCATTWRSSSPRRTALGFYTNLITSGVGPDRGAHRGAEARRARSHPAVLPGQHAAR